MPLRVCSLRSIKIIKAGCVFVVRLVVYILARFVFLVVNVKSQNNKLPIFSL